jgi:hypothetical protein
LIHPQLHHQHHQKMSMSSEDNNLTTEEMWLGFVDVRDSTVAIIRKAQDVHIKRYYKLVAEGKQEEADRVYSQLIELQERIKKTLTEAAEMLQNTVAEIEATEAAK